MSTTRNTEAVANQEPGGGSGEIKPRIEPEGPQTTKGHKPGTLVGNDTVPEFNAKTLPPGSAPASKTYEPNTEAEAPAPDPSGTAQTLPGTSSADVHTGLGHPGAGQTSAEIRHDGEKGRKNPGKSLQGVGASTEEFKTVDPHDPKFKNHRALDNDDAEVGRGNIGGPPAEERVPVSASGVAAEHSKKERADRGT